MRVKYTQIHDGDKMEVPPLWIVACCDCGLVHRIKFKLEKPEGKRQLRMLTMQVWRDNLRTALKRRHKGVKIVKVARKTNKKVVK